MMSGSGDPSRAGSALRKPFDREIRRVLAWGSSKLSSLPPGAFQPEDLFYMQRALQLAKKGRAIGEVPVGAVLVTGDSIAGEGFNCPISASDPTAHAEIQAVRAAASHLGNYRLVNATLYTTLEPCVMCVGALVLARVERLVFAARDLRFGAVRSKFSLADSPLLNHRIRIVEGLLAAEAGELLAEFFRSTRRRNSETPP